MTRDVTPQEQAEAIMQIANERINPAYAGIEILLAQAHVLALLALTVAIQEAVDRP